MRLLILLLLIAVPAYADGVKDLGRYPGLNQVIVSSTATPTATATVTPTPTNTATPTPTATATNTPTATPTAFICRQLFSDTATHATTGTTKQTLSTYTIPANTLASNGQSVHIQTSWTCANNANSKVANIDFGSFVNTTKITTTVAGTANGGGIVQDVTYYRAGASSERISGLSIASDDNAALAAGQIHNGNPTESTASGITVNVTGTTASGTGDLSLVLFTVEACN